MQSMSIAIKNLLELGAIKPCLPKHSQFISKIFLAPKSNGGHRFILNLKPLNKFVEVAHFKMEDYRTASKLIPPNGYLATIDLKESYLLVPMAQEHRKYLRFHVEDIDTQTTKLYEFQAIPYGLSAAPRTFTKIIKEVITYLRNKGFRSVQYLDDILCIGDNYLECLKNVKETLRTLECLGFVVNYDKSSLEPQQCCKFLGFVYNSTDMTLSLPDEKRNNIAHLVGKFSLLPSCTIREFAQLIGVLTAACPAVKYGWLYTKILERHKYLSLLKTDDFETKIKLPSIILEDLVWWKQNIYTTCTSLKTLQFKLEIFTDASRTGWGAVCENSRINGKWKSDELQFHINYLELLAVFLAVKWFTRNISDCAILLRVDNTTAISYVNRMGGVQFPHLNALSRRIWQWCEERKIWLFASYINTKDNREADEESRRINPDTEWELCNEAFNFIIQKLGQPEVDLFASRTNAKCENYLSWHPDPDAIAIDAFTINWDQKYFYAFPPFSLLLKCLQKILCDKATGILVFPIWPSQAWYPLLHNLLASEIIFLNPHKDLLHSNFRTHHPLHKKLILGAAVLSGSRSVAGGHLQAP